MSKVRLRKKGISLVALVITIIVLIILTGAVVITTINSNMIGNIQTTNILVQLSQRLKN